MLRTNAKNQQVPDLLGHDIRVRTQDRAENARKSYEDVLKKVKLK